MFKNSFTLVDVLVGISLMLIVFLGIFGAYQLGIKTIAQSRNKINATAIANQQIEVIRNLPYDSVGVSGSFPDGILESSTSIFQNNVEYTIETRVDFIIDSADGIAPPEDECPNDYKKVEVKVSWQGRFPSEIKIVSNIAPKNLAQECAIGGGILSVAVFDAYGVMVLSPLIEVRDPLTEEVLKDAQPLSGEHYFSLAADTYKVIVSKPDYSTERTYGVDEIATPEKPHPIVLEDGFIETSFSIDKVSSCSVNTLSPWGQDSLVDPFNDESKISELNNIVVIGGAVKLASTTEEGYLSPGYLISTSIAPIGFLSWDKFSFSDSDPSLTNLKYQICSTTDTGWLLIPDSDLLGNSEGFDSSPVDLSGLAISKYPEIKIKAIASSSDSALTPVLGDWQVSWLTSEATPIPNKTFNLQGAKIIGTDEDEEPVYKYYQDHTSDSGGQINLSNLEWDAYNFSIAPASGLDLVDISPSLQPIDLSPDSFLEVDLYLDAENSFLLTLKDQTTLGPVFAASARLYSVPLVYDTTQYTDIKGQTYFIPLAPGNYNLAIQAAGYADFATNINISGDVTRTISLEQIE